MELSKTPTFYASVVNATSPTRPHAAEARGRSTASVDGRGALGFGEAVTDGQFHGGLSVRLAATARCVAGGLGARWWERLREMGQKNDGRTYCRMIVGCGLGPPFGEEDAGQRHPDVINASHLEHLQLYAVNTAFWGACNF
jgi:hypothetical protein